MSAAPVEVGNDAWYPAAATAASSSSVATRAGSNSTVASSVAKLTVASTPESPFSSRSTRPAHAAQCIPSIGSRRRVGCVAVATTR